MRMRRYRYWNANGFAVAVVAAVNVLPPREGDGPDEPFDWAVYIGATEGGKMCEEQTVDFVEVSGCKLSKQEACAFFSEFADIPYRN